MRISKTVFLFMVALAGVTLAGPADARGWLKQYGGGPTLDDVRMVSTTTGYTVGSSGTMLKTTDGGASWSSVSNAAYASYDFNAVDAIGETVFVVGVNHIMRTRTGGVRFDDVSPAGLTLDGSADLHGVDFVNTSIGFVVGGKTGSGIAFKTTDGGDSWTTLTGFLPLGTGILRDISCINGSICYAVGDGGEVIRTASGGTSWTAQDSTTSANLLSVSAISSSSAWAVGALGVIRKTTNGSTWTNPGSPASNTFYGVDFTSSSIGALVGASGAAYITSDGGIAWEVRTLPGGATPTLLDVDMVTGNMGMAVGIGGNIYRFDGSGPTVGAVTPITAIAGVSQAYSVSYSDIGGVGVENCILNYNELEGVTTTLSSPNGTNGTASGAHTFTTAGSATLQGVCTDLAGNSGESAQATITVGSGNSAPVTPTSIAMRTVLDGANQAVGFTNATTQVVFVGTVTDPDSDDVMLQLEVQPVGISFTNTPTDFNLRVASGSTVQISRNYFTAGTAYHWQARANDVNNNVSAWVPFGGNSEAAADFTIAASAPPSGNNPPNLPSDLTQHDSAFSTVPGEITSVSGAQGVGYVDDDGAVTLHALASDPDGGTLRLDVEVRALGTAFTNVATQTDTGVSSTAFYGIPAGLANGSYHWQARVVDSAGTASSWISFGANAESAADFSVSRSVAAVTFPSGFAAGDLVKLSNDGNPNTFGDTAVFYLGADGNRYVFTNDKSYFTWYANFNSIRVISTTDLAAIPLRGNVTYRPGVKMVKLQTSPTVYVVTARGLLRAVPSEAVAAALYGSNWNREIDDINDAFWTNYTVGATLTVASDFNRVSVTNAATNISVDKGL